MTRPSAAAEATDEPVMAPKMAEAPLAPIEAPPETPPTRVCIRSNRYLAKPERSMMLPARMKNGIASRTKLSRPENIDCATWVNEVTPKMATAARPVSQSANATGRPNASIASMLPINMNAILFMPPRWQPACRDESRSSAAGVAG